MSASSEAAMRRRISGLQGGYEWLGQLYRAGVAPRAVEALVWWETYKGEAGEAHLLRLLNQGPGSAGWDELRSLPGIGERALEDLMRWAMTRDAPPIDGKALKADRGIVRTVTFKTPDGVSHGTYALAQSHLLHTKLVEWLYQALIADGLTNDDSEAAEAAQKLAVRLRRDWSLTRRKEAAGGDQD